MLVAAVVVKLVTVATASCLAVGPVTCAASHTTSVDSGGINSLVIDVLGLLNESGERARAAVLTRDVVVASVVMLSLSGTGDCSEASKSEGLEHFRISSSRFHTAGI